MDTIVEHINSAGRIFVEFALPMLIQSSVLIAILLLVDLLLRKKVKAVFRYWIWMLVLLKLILPTSLSSPLSLGYLFGDKLTYQDLAQTSPILEPAVPAPVDISPGMDPLFIQPNPYIPPTEPVISVLEPAIAGPVIPPQVPVTPLSWHGVVFLVWLAVVIAMGLLLLQRALFVRGLVAQAKKAGCLMNDALAYCSASMGIKSKVGLKVSVNATTPSVCGLIRPVILMPWNLASTLGASRLRTILMHELAHIKRGDLWVNLAQTALQIIYFYNPLLWLANCVIRRIREQAVDEAVLVAMGGKAQQYPQTLVDVAKMAFKRPALSLRLIGVVESKSALAGRIKHILGRPMPKSAKLGMIGLLAVIIAGAVLLPMARAQRLEFTGRGGPLDIRLAGVRPDGGDDVYDGSGNKIAENTFANIAKEWGEDKQHRTFIFELPKTAEPILFSPFLKIKPAGAIRGFGTAQHPLLYYSAGKLTYSVAVDFPRTYKKVFERRVKKIDLTLHYYYGQRGAADFVFSGPFTPAQTVKAQGGADCELTATKDRLDFSNHPAALFRISSKTRFDPDSVLVYDTSGRRYLPESGGGGSGSGGSERRYCAEGLTLNSIAYVTVGEKPYEAAFKNVVVSYPDRPVPERLEFLDEMYKRLDLTGFSGDLLNDYRFENPADAIKVIDIVRGRRYVMRVFNAIMYSKPGIELSSLDPQAQQKLRSAAAGWAEAGHPNVRAMGIRLGLVAGWPEFMDLALEWLEQDVIVYDMVGRAYRGLEEEAKEEIAGEIANYPIALNSEQAERLKKIILRTDSPRLGMRLFRLFWRADKDLIFQICWDLVQDERPWIWWPAMYSLSNRCNEKLRPFENLPEKMQKRKILVHEAGGGSSRLFDVSSSGKDYETVAKEAYAMLPGIFTAQLARMNGSTCHDVRQVMAKHLDREIATKAMTDFLREISTESNQRLWAGDSPYFGTCRSTAYYIARHINSLYDVNIDNLGKYETPEKADTIPRNISRLKQLIAKILQWYDGRSGENNDTGRAREIGAGNEAGQSPFTATLPNGVTVEQPATIKVPEDYPTVPAAVEAAEAGDTIVVSGERARGEDILIEPELEFLAWHKTDRDNYWHVDGSIVSDKNDLRILKNISHPGCGDPQHPNYEWLKLSFSHPSFDEKSYIDLRMINDTGEHRKFVSVTAAGAENPEPRNGNRGWVLYTVSLGTKEDFPRQCNFELDYAIGQWKTEIKELPKDDNGIMTFGSGFLLGSIGQNAEGKTTIDYTHKKTETSHLQHRFVAVTQNGIVPPSGHAQGGYPDLYKDEYRFDIPLEEIQHFQFQTRKVKTVTFKNVSLEPNFKTDVQIKTENNIQAPPLKDFERELIEQVLDLVKQVEKKYPDQATHWPAGPGLYHVDAQGHVTVWHYQLLWHRSTDCAEDEVGWGSSQLVKAKGMYYLPDGTPLQSRWSERGGGMKDIRVKVGRTVGKDERVPVIHRHRLPSDHDLLSRDGRKRKIEFTSWEKSPVAIIVRIDKPVRLGSWWLGDAARIHHYEDYDQLFAMAPPGDYQPMYVFFICPEVLDNIAKTTLQPGFETDVQIEVEETISPKLVMLLGAINSCAAETKLNIESISITAKSINIQGDTSSRTDTLKFLDAIKKNELEVLQLSFVARDNRNKFSLVVKPKENWQKWWQRHKTDVHVGVEETISPKLVMLLGAINSCAAEIDLNIESISIKENNIEIKGDTAGRTNTLNFLDAVKKNELEVLRLSDIARKDNRSKFSLVVEPKENWQQWWRQHKADIEAEGPTKEDAVSNPLQPELLSATPPIFAYNVKLNFADPTVRDGTFHSEQSIAFSLSFHNIEIPPAGKFTLSSLLIGQTTWPVHLEDNGITIKEGVAGQKIRSLTWPADEPKFEKVIKIPVKYGQKEYSCPVRVELDRREEGDPIGSYWFCAYLSGRLPWGAGGRGFEIVNLDQQMEFRLTGDGTDPRDAVLGIDIDGDGRIDPAKTGGEQFDLYEPFQIGAKTYRLTEVDPYLPRVVFRELVSEKSLKPPVSTDVPVEVDEANPGFKALHITSPNDNLRIESSDAQSVLVLENGKVSNISSNMSGWFQATRLQLKLNPVTIDLDGQRNRVHVSGLGCSAEITPQNGLIEVKWTDGNQTNIQKGGSLKILLPDFQITVYDKAGRRQSLLKPRQRKGLISGEAIRTDVLVGTGKAVGGEWEDIGNPIPADFNDTMALTEQITLRSIGQDVEGKSFITFVWDKEKNRNRQYRFVLIKNNDTILEPDSHLILVENKRLEEKFTFDEPYVSWRLKEFKLQSRPPPLAGNRSISSKLQKGTSTAFEGKTISPSRLAPPGRYAIELDGVDDYLLVPDSPTLRLDPPFTVEMWIKPRLPEQKVDRVQQWGVIAQGGYVGTGRAKPRGFGIELVRFEKEPETFNVSYHEANDSGLFGQDYGRYHFDEWIHISHVFEGENYNPSRGHPLVVGRFLIPFPEPFMGQIGEVRIWNTAREREEIRRYKDVALTGKEPGLAACWTFEQAEGQFAYDISGNNNHARLGKAIEPDDADPKWVDLEAASRKPDRIANVPVESEREKGTSAERRTEFFGLDLTDAPRTTKWADLPDLFEARPPGSKSYHRREDVDVVYAGLYGTVYYIPEKEVFYIQHDKLGSSTRNYYGPFNGDPHQVLDRQKDVSIKAEEAEASSGESEPAANEDGPRITFESLVCDLGQIPPRTKNVCEFKYTNTGNALLKITRVGAACACTVPQKTKECAPGESGTLKVTYRASERAGRVTKPVYVYSNDKVNPKVTLTIKAEIVVKVDHKPERLNLLFKGENAGCPPITLTSLDNQPFSITGFKSTGDSITADFDSSVKESSFVLQPKVDMEKLRKGLRGQIEIGLTHPECKKVTIIFDTLAEFKVDPRVIYVREAEPLKTVTKKVRVLSNYNEDVEIESTSSKKDIIKVLTQEKIQNGYQFELQITPPAVESKRRVFTDVFTVRLKDGQVLNVTCYGIYSKKPAETKEESVPKTNAQVEARVSESKAEKYEGKTIDEWISRWDSELYDDIREATAALTRIGRPAVPAMIEQIKKRSNHGWRAVGVLSKMGPEAEDALELLIEMALDKDLRFGDGRQAPTAYRGSVLYSLSDMKWARQRVIPVLQRIAEDGEEEAGMRKSVIWALRRVGKGAMPILQKLTEAEERSVRDAAHGAIGQLLEKEEGLSKEDYFTPLIEKDPFDPSVLQYLGNTKGMVNYARPHPLTQRTKKLYRERLAKEPDAQLAWRLATIIQNGLKNTELMWAAPTDGSKGRSPREDPTENYATLAEVLQLGFDHAESGSQLQRQFGTSLAKLRLLQGDWNRMNAVLQKLGQEPIPKESRQLLHAPPEDWQDDLHLQWKIADESMRSGKCSLEFKIEKDGKGLKGVHFLVKRAPEQTNVINTGISVDTLFYAPTPMKVHFGSFGYKAKDRPMTRYAISDESGIVRFDKLPDIPVKIEVLVPTSNFPEAVSNWDLWMEVEPGKFKIAKMYGGADAVGRGKPPDVEELREGETVHYPKLVVRPVFGLNVRDWTRVDKDNFVLSWAPMDSTTQAKTARCELEMFLSAPPGTSDRVTHAPVLQSAKIIVEGNRWPVGEKGVGKLRLEPGNIYVFEIRALDTSGVVIARWPRTRVWTPWDHRTSDPPYASVPLRVRGDVSNRPPIHNRVWHYGSFDKGTRRRDGLREKVARFLSDSTNTFEYEYVRMGKAWLDWHDDRQSARRQLEQLVKELPEGNVARGTALWLIQQIDENKDPPKRLNFVPDRETSRSKVVSLPEEKADVQIEVERSSEASEATNAALTVPEAAKTRGGISGVVVSSVTGEPIAGAYVGVGDFGDSGGSNYSRHRSQGFHDKTKTDEKGRFELGGLVFTDKHRYLKYHPLVVTHPDFVRHDEEIELLSSGPVPDVKVTLRQAAKIDVTIVDADGNPLEGQWLIRLEALDGRRFIPPGSDPHLSSFSSSIWAHMPDLRTKMGVSNGFTFTELDTGEYLLEAIRLHLVDKPTPQKIWESSITYHGAIEKLKVEAGRTKQVQIKPANHQTAVTLKMPETPEIFSGKQEIPRLLTISRKLGLLLWDTNKAYGLEDPRLGRLQKNAFFYTLVPDSDVFTIKNLPPGSYCVFAGPVMCMSAAKVDVVRGRQITIQIPKVQFDGTAASVGVWTLDRKVKLQAGDYSVSDLCGVLTDITQSNPRLIADPSIENEKLSFGRGDMSVWDVLEKLYMDKGWTVDEGKEKTLIIRPADKTDVPDEGGSRISRLLAALQNEKYVHIHEPIIQMVEEIGDKEPISFLTEQLKLENRRRKCDAALALELLGDRRGVPAIIKELNDTSYRPTTMIRSDSREYQEGQIRQDHYYAALLLGILGDERAVPALIEATADETIDYRAAMSLGEIGDKRAVPALRAMLDKNLKPFQRLFAGYGLAMLNEEEGLKVVIDTLDNQELQWTVRSHAIEALGKLGDKEAIPYLITALKDDHPNIRVSAARALGAIGDASALSALEEALKDNTETKVNAPTTVSKAAAEAIAQIKAGNGRIADVPVDVEGAGEKVSQFIGVDLPASVQNVKFHSGSFAESSRTLIRFDIPLPDLKSLLAKSDKLPDFPDLNKNPKIQKDMVEVYKALNIEWWRPDELERPVCAAWIISERAKGNPRVWIVNILNICCSQTKNVLMRVYIDFFSHAH